MIKMSEKKVFNLTISHKVDLIILYNSQSDSLRIINLYINESRIDYVEKIIEAIWISTKNLDPSFFPVYVR